MPGNASDSDGDSDDGSGRRRKRERERKRSGDRPERVRTIHRAAESVVPDRGTEGDDGEANERPDPRTRLHRSIGNSGVQRLHEAGALQASLEVSQPEDPHEREAERVAEAVMGMDDPVATANRNVEVQRAASAGGNDPVVGGDLESEIRSLKGGGRRLPESTRSFFESRFDRDFSDVRVHTGPKADEAARSINAEAFTHGRDIAFRSGAYRPGTRAGKQLLAHELTHVVQSSGGGRSVHRSSVTQEEQLEALKFAKKVEELLDSRIFKTALEQEIKEVFKQFGFDESEKEEFRKAIRDGKLAGFADKFMDSGYHGTMKKLVTAIRAKSVLKQLKEFRKKHDEGFEYQESTIEDLRTDVETIQENIDMGILRRKVIGELLEDTNRIDARFKTQTLIQYLESDAFRSDLESSGNRSTLIKNLLAVLSATTSREQASETTRKAIGTLVEVESQNRLLEMSDSARTEAIKEILKGVGKDNAFSVGDVYDKGVGWSNRIGKVAKSLNDGLNKIKGGQVNAHQWIAALDNTDGEMATVAKTYVQKLDSQGKLGAFVAATTLLSMKWPDDVQTTLKDAGSLGAFVGGAPDIARVFGMTDEALQTTKFGKVLRVLGKYLGPAGDFITAIADSIKAHQQFEKGDVGAGIGASVTAAGGAVALGMTIFGSSWWSGVGAIVGLGTALVGAGIGYLWGESSTETKLESMGLVKDTDMYLIPFF